MANVKPSAFGSTITPAATTILTGETAGGTAGRFAVSALTGIDSEGVGYLAPYTGSASRTVENRLSEVVSANDFSGTATAKILAAAAVCAGTDKTLLIPAGNWTCTQLDLSEVRRIVCEGMILSTAINADGYAVRIGTANANTGLNMGNIQIRLEHSSGSNAGLSGLDGIRIRGAGYATFQLYAGYFGIGIAIRGSGANEYYAFNQMNNSRTYSCVTGLNIQGVSGAWCNQNMFTNCTFVGSTDGIVMQGSFPADNNVFTNAELENCTTPIRIIQGKMNLFEFPRFESSGNVVFGDNTTGSFCSRNRIRGAYAQNNFNFPQVTHQACYPNFVEGVDGQVWRNILSVSIDDFVVIGTGYYSRKLRNWADNTSKFNSMTLDASIGVRSFKLVGEGAYFTQRVKKGDVFRVTVKWANSLTSLGVISAIARNDADSADAATLTAGDIPYLGCTNDSSFGNGTSTTVRELLITASNYPVSRNISVNRSDFNNVRWSFDQNAEYQWIRIDKLSTELSREDFPDDPFPPVKAISSLATGPDYIGQIGIVTTSNLIVFAISATAWNCLTGTATWDPASLAQGAQATTTITVTGAAVGNRCEVKFSLSLTATGTLSLTGFVSAANTVTAVLQNNGTSAADLASGTVTAYVWAG